jgi:hypothetical protein
MSRPNAEHQRENPRKGGDSVRVSDGTRTRDRLDHNQELYQLSYAHHGVLRVTWYAAFGGGGSEVRERMTDDDIQHPNPRPARPTRARTSWTGIVNW